MANLTLEGAEMLTVYYERHTIRGRRRTLMRLVSRRFYRLFWDAYRYLQWYGTSMRLLRVGQGESRPCTILLNEARLVLERGFCKTLDLHLWDKNRGYDVEIAYALQNWLNRTHMPSNIQLHLKLSCVDWRFRDIIRSFVTRSTIWKLTTSYNIPDGGNFISLTELLTIFPRDALEELEIVDLCCDRRIFDMPSILNRPVQRLLLSGKGENFQSVMRMANPDLSTPVQKELVIHGSDYGGSAIFTIRRFVEILPHLETVICFWEVWNEGNFCSRTRKRKAYTPATIKREDLGTFKGKCILVWLYNSFIPRTATTLSEEFPPADLSKHLGFSERKFIRLFKECGHRFAIESREDDIVIINAQHSFVCNNECDCGNSTSPNEFTRVLWE